jgi:hypothetical protein
MPDAPDFSLLAPAEGGAADRSCERSGAADVERRHRTVILSEAKDLWLFEEEILRRFAPQDDTGEVYPGLRLK